MRTPFRTYGGTLVFKVLSVSAVVILCARGAFAIEAQSSGANAHQQTATSAAKKTSPGTSISVSTIDVDRQAPPQLTVENDVSISLTIEKRTIETCKVDSKREPLPEVANPIGTILGAAFKTLASGFSEGVCDKPATATPADDAAQRAAAMLDILLPTIKESLDFLASNRTAHVKLADRIRAFVNCVAPTTSGGESGLPSAPTCNNADDSAKELNAIVEALAVVLATDQRGVASSEALVKGFGRGTRRLREIPRGADRSSHGQVA
jgi:hypothetical protein